MPLKGSAHACTKSQMPASLQEFDDVIKRLERCLDTVSEDVMVEVELRIRALEVMARGISAATNIAEIVRKFFGLG